MSEKAIIRAARFGDVPAIYGLLCDAHALSRLHNHGLGERDAKAVIVNCLQRHGGTTAGSTYVAVAERGGKVEAFIIGILQPLYAVLASLEATDLFWIAAEGAHPASASRLLRSMHRWARTAPQLGLIRQGVTDIISDPEVTGRLLQRHGMKRCGFIYERGGQL